MELETTATSDLIQRWTSASRRHSKDLRHFDKLEVSGVAKSAALQRRMLRRCGA